jgi:hypothetical protein
LIFDHAAEKVSDGDSGRSRVATIARQRIPAERLHPKATSWRCRPIAEVRRAIKQTFNAAIQLGRASAVRCNRLLSVHWHHHSHEFAIT